jgi:hypothetical protein
MIVGAERPLDGAVFSEKSSPNTVMHEMLHGKEILKTTQNLWTSRAGAQLS